MGADKIAALFSYFRNWKKGITTIWSAPIA